MKTIKNKHISNQSINDEDLRIENICKKAGDNSYNSFTLNRDLSTLGEDMSNYIQKNVMQSLNESGISVGDYANPYSDNGAYSTKLEDRISRREPIKVDNTNVREVVKLAVDILGRNADLNFIDVSSVTDARKLFANMEFCGDVTKWDTSNFRHIDFMFYNSSIWGDFNFWDVSNVTSMVGLCKNASFYACIDKWDTSSVIFMTSAFENAILPSYKCNLVSDWNTSSVVSMCGMFNRSNFNGSLLNWNVSNVKNMSFMFFMSHFNQPIYTWDVSNVKNMSFMFENSKFGQDISHWHINKNCYIDDMCKNCKMSNNDLPIMVAEKLSAEMKKNEMDVMTVATDETIKQIVLDGIKKYGINADLNYIDTSRVTSMNELFSMSDFNGDISKWNVSNVRTAVNMFRCSNFNGDISNWDVSSLVDATGMFQYSEFNKPITFWNTICLKNANSMFASSKYNHPLNWRVNSVEDMSHMFSHSVFNKPLANWDVSSVKKMGWMFAFSKFNQEIHTWDVSNVYDTEHMFTKSEFNKNIKMWRYKLLNLNKISKKTMFEDSNLLVKYNPFVEGCDVYNDICCRDMSCERVDDIDDMKSNLNKSKNDKTPIYDEKKMLPLKSLSWTITNEDGTKSVLTIKKSIIDRLPKIKIDKDYEVNDFDPTNYAMVMLDNGCMLNKLQTRSAREAKVNEGDVVYSFLYANTFIIGTVTNIQLLGINRISGMPSYICTIKTELGDFYVTQDNLFSCENNSSLSKKNKEILYFVEDTKNFVAGQRYFIYNELIKKSNRKVYELKKCVYSINEYNLNMLVMKQVKGTKGKKFTLTLNDCKHLGIEFEPGLEVFPMELSWCNYV